MKPMTLMLNKAGCRCWAALLGLCLPAFGLWAADTNAPQATAPAPQTNAAPSQASAPAPQAAAAPSQASAPAPQTNAAPSQASAPAPQTNAAPPQASAPAPQTNAAPSQASAPAPQTNAVPPQAPAPAPQTNAAPPQAAALAPPPPEQMFEVGTNSFNNWIDFSTGGFITSGNKAQFQKRHQTSDGAFGGVEDFHFQKDLRSEEHTS